MNGRKKSTRKVVSFARRDADRYEIATATIGVPMESLWAFERDVYLRFFAGMLEVSRWSIWSEAERYSVVDGQKFPGGWLHLFCQAYKERLQTAVAELAELLARWATANYQPGHPIESREILRITFLFADELRAPDFARLWLALVLDRTKGPEVPGMNIPRDFGADIFAATGSLENLPLNSLLRVPDPQAIDIQTRMHFSVTMKGTFWKEHATRTAMRKINLIASLAPATRQRRRGHGLLGADIPPLNREDIMKRESLRMPEACAALCVGPRTIRTYSSDGRLDRTEHHRISINDKFWNLFDKKHRPNQ